MSKETIAWEDFKKIEIRVGTIIKAEELENAKKPAIRLLIDFGPIGILKSSAQITSLYDVEDLPGKQVFAVVNFPPKQITNFMSECLVLGVIGEEDEVTLIIPDKAVKNGLRVG